MVYSDDTLINNIIVTFCPPPPHTHTHTVIDQIRTVVGQAQLLMTKKMKQYVGLVTQAQHNDKKTSDEDLQVYMHILYYCTVLSGSVYSGTPLIQTCVFLYSLYMYIGWCLEVCLSCICIVGALFIICFSFILILSYFHSRVSGTWCQSKWTMCVASLSVWQNWNETTGNSHTWNRTEPRNKERYI